MKLWVKGYGFILVLFMNMKKMKSVLKYISVIALSFSCVTGAWAAGEKERMIERAPQIRALKSAGIVGEKANGLLGFVKESPADKAVVDAENKDRKAVYSEIAKGQGVRASVVAQRRALQIAEQAASGDWLQNANGKWIQKK